MGIEGENYCLWEVMNPLNPSLSGTTTERGFWNNSKIFLLKIKFSRFNNSLLGQKVMWFVYHPQTWFVYQENQDTWPQVQFPSR